MAAWEWPAVWPNAICKERDLDAGVGRRPNHIGQMRMHKYFPEVMQSERVAVIATSKEQKALVKGRMPVSS